MTATRDGGSPLIRTLRAMNAISAAETELTEREKLLVRLACLIATDAPRASYLVNLAGPSAPALDRAEVEAVLVAAAPLVGSARAVSAAERIAEATGFAISAHDLYAAETTGD